MDEDEDGFTIRGDWAAEGSPSIVGHYSLADFGKLAVWNLSRGFPLIINDNLAELAPEEARTFQDIGIAATICMPLLREGMAPEVIARAFDPFYTTKPTGQGTGLSLSMVYGFAGQSGGTVRIASDVGKGTMICVYLPRHIGSIHSDDMSVEAAGPLHLVGGETILVVDD
jgi:hypothetical protein